jgi:hypothetical protein
MVAFPYPQNTGFSQTLREIPMGVNKKTAIVMKGEGEAVLTAEDGPTTQSIAGNYSGSLAPASYRR